MCIYIFTILLSQNFTRKNCFFFSFFQFFTSFFPANINQTPFNRALFRLYIKYNKIRTFSIYTTVSRRFVLRQVFILLTLQARLRALNSLFKESIIHEYSNRSYYSLIKKVSYYWISYLYVPCYIYIYINIQLNYIYFSFSHFRLSLIRNKREKILIL